GRERPCRRIEKAQLALVLTLRFARQLFDASEWHLLCFDKRALRLHWPYEAFLHEVEFAHRLAGKDRRRLEAGLARERCLELAQGGVLANAANEPARDLIAALVVEVARRLCRQHHAEAGGAGALQKALQRLGGGRLGVGRNVEIGFVEHDDGLQLVIRIALAEAQRFGKELRHPEEDVLVVAEKARVDDRQARATLAGVGTETEQGFHAQRLTAGLKQCGGAVAETVELGNEIAANLARGVHALREI